MSFMNGPDCGPVNPMQSLLKSHEQDASIQRDRFQQIPTAGSSNGASMRTQNGRPAGALSQAELDREMQQFSFGMPAHMQAGPSSSSGQDAFAMQAMQRELAQFHQANGASPQHAQVDPNWAKQFSPGRVSSPLQQQQQHQGPAWSQSFAGQQHQQPEAQTSSYAGPSTMQNGFMGAQGLPYQSPMQFFNPMSMPQPMYQPQMSMQPPTATADSKGKSRFVELDDTAWEAQFAKLDESKTEQAKDTAQGTEADEVLREAEGYTDESDEQFLANLEHTWKNLKDTMDTSNLNDHELAAWEAQYGTNFADLHGDYDSETTINPFNPAEFDEWLKKATSEPFPFAKEEENPYINAFDPFADGQRLLREGHPLAEAALAFEAACRQNEHRGEAWKALGDTLAADEKELKAIKALERAVACPDNGGEGAWMSLAISYVNEGQDMRAFATLEKWLVKTYPAVQTKIEPLPETERANPWSTQNKIVEQFLWAARTGPQARHAGTKDLNNPYVDADVQSGMGVLYYTASDYVRARDCFEAALSARPDDFLLWNRLGATLANGGQPEEAIEAYRKALELRPTFTRAIYNLGVSCLNINCFQEAAEHLLAALELHRKDQLVGKGKGPERDEALELDDGSENLWSTLRRAFLCMERSDLADRAHPGGDVASFRKDGFEF